MSSVPFSISALDTFFFAVMHLSNRSSMGTKHIPLEFLCKEMPVDVTLNCCDSAANLGVSLDRIYVLLTYTRLHNRCSKPWQIRPGSTSLRVLPGREHSVNDIVESVDIDQSGVSRHLRILQEAGFVRVRPEGQKRFYSLCPEPFRDLDSWLSQYRQLWEGRLDKFGEALTRKRKAKTIAPQKTRSSRREHHERKSE